MGIKLIVAIEISEHTASLYRNAVPECFPSEGTVCFDSAFLKLDPNDDSFVIAEFRGIEECEPVEMPKPVRIECSDPFGFNS